MSDAPPMKVLEYPIADTSPYWDDAKPKPIKHVLLTVIPKKEMSDPHAASVAALPQDALIFSVVPISDHDVAADAADMGRYAAEKARLGQERPVPLAPATPFDIGVERQCWLLIQLDQTVNWQFTVQQLPCTTKKPDPTGDNVYLRHVYPDDDTPYAGEIERDGCQTIYFGIAHRLKNDPAMDPDPGSCFVNFAVEFLQDLVAGKPKKRLPLIIDPDVKNDGGFDIP